MHGNHLCHSKVWVDTKARPQRPPGLGGRAEVGGRTFRYRRWPLHPRAGRRKGRGTLCVSGISAAIALGAAWPRPRSGKMRDDMGAPLGWWMAGPKMVRDQDHKPQALQQRIDSTTGLGHAPEQPRGKVNLRVRHVSGPKAWSICLLFFCWTIPLH